MKILFVCRGNVGRSQIAAAFFNTASKKHHAMSAGYEVGEHEGEPLVEPVIACMKELGYDLSKETRTQLTPEMVKEAGRIIIPLQKHERGALPEYLKNSPKVTYWPVQDGKGKSYGFHVKMRNQLKKRVEELVGRLG